MKNKCPFCPGPAVFGLGLTLCQSIVNEHGGTIEIESQADVGTTVHIYLPRTPLQQESLSA